MLRFARNDIFAFTLAEVLVTLGIIGVVAALTIPALIANHKKQVTVTRLEKFYSVINQAIKMSSLENREPEGWEGVEMLDANSMYIWWNKYMNNYFTSKDVVKTNDGIIITLADGSGFGIYSPASNKREGISWVHIVYCIDYKSCKKHLDRSGGKLYPVSLDGKNTFLFNGSQTDIRTYGSGNDRYVLINETGTSQYGCAKSYKAYCAALIQYDGWKISDDYPIRF